MPALKLDGNALATGHGFSSPFYGDTGPTAWAAPIYPYVVAAAFKIFGIYTHAASFALLTFNSFFAALTCWTIYRTALRVFNRAVAIWSGWIWALLPYTIFWAAPASRDAARPGDRAALRARSGPAGGANGQLRRLRARQ